MNTFSTKSLYSFSYDSISFLKGELAPAFTQNQKRIAILALAAFMCLAACYALFHCFCKSKVADINDDDKKNAAKGGAVIEGDIQNGKLHGKGKKSYPDGRVWEGTFEHGMLEGKGKRIFADGSVATGIFQDGELIQGKLSDKHDWNISEGTFKEYRLNGQGKRTNVNKEVEDGEFINGEFVKGTKSLLNDGLAEGEFKDGKLHGKGKMTWTRTQPEQVIYEGQFFSGQLVKGKEIDHVGNVHEGDFATSTGGGNIWKNDGKLEKGMITYFDGTKEEGEFAFTHGNRYRLYLNGKGKRTEVDGSIEEGIFQDGILMP